MFDNQIERYVEAVTILLTDHSLQPNPMDAARTSLDGQIV